MLIDPANVFTPMIQPAIKDYHQKQLERVVELMAEEKAELINACQAGKARQVMIRAELAKMIQHRFSGFAGDTRFYEDALALLLGYGPLEPYLTDPLVTDILGNSKDIWFVKKRGYQIRIPLAFESEQSYLKFLYRVAATAGGKIDENQNAAAVFTDRQRLMRIVVTLGPLGITSPVIAIRKHAAAYTFGELIREEMLMPEQACILKAAVENRQTIVIAGRGGSGKTTLMASLIDHMPSDQRAVLLQETCEVIPKHPNITNKMIRLSDNALVKDYTLFELTKLALLESVDRIFIAELKDKEAFDFFNAIYTGHTGSMTTLHSPVKDLNPEAVINRLLQLMARAALGIPHTELRSMLEKSLDIIVFMEGFKVLDIVAVGAAEEGERCEQYER